MTLLLGALVLALLVVVAFAAYQFSEANRWRQAAAETQRENDSNRKQLDETKYAAVQQEAEIAKHREVAAVQLQLLTQTQHQLEDKFRALAADALQSNSQLFLDRSKEQIAHLVDPVNQTLHRFEEQVQAIERARVGAYADISAQVTTLTHLQERVRLSTDQLKTALRSPIQRGRWGEVQLRRVVEMAGMMEHCDFDEQKTLFGETTQRPDLVVKLPSNCHIVVDAKVSLDAYLRAIEAESETDRTRLLLDHAKQVRTHIKALSEKSYWQGKDGSPDFVVAFLPLESLFSAALESDPTLLEFGVKQRVVIATPVTLISLLLAVSHGWRQQALAENVDKIRDTGQELYSRLLTMSNHFARLGEAIEKTVTTYNQTVGSLERSVLSSARKFKELQPALTEELSEPEIVESAPRTLEPSKWQLMEGVKTGSASR